MEKYFPHFEQSCVPKRQPIFSKSVNGHYKQEFIILVQRESVKCPMPAPTHCYKWSFNTFAVPITYELLKLI